MSLRVQALRGTMLAAAVLVLGCQGPVGPHDGGAAPDGDVHLYFRVALVGTSVVGLAVEVTAPDIPLPIVQNVEVVGGIAEGTLVIPAGSDRHLVVRAFDVNGIETHRGETTIDVYPGTNPVVEVVLEPLFGSVPIVIVMGEFTLDVQPELLTLRPGDSALLTATLRAGDGTVVTRPLTWGSRNPVVAGVDATGLVTAGVVGETEIVVSYGSFRDVVVMHVTGFRWEKVVVGEYHSCALDDAGRAYCWGHNSTGQLGDGTLTDRRVPTPVAGDRRFRWIAAGGLQSCGVTLDGDGYCWGRGVALGHGVWTNSPVPALVLGGHSWRSIDMGIWHACGVTTAGEGYCWGYGSNGRLGTGSTTDQAEPVLLAGRVFEMISAGRDHSCGVAAGGAALCWGYGGWGQLGNGAGASALSPTPVSGTGLLWDVVSAGGAHSCGVLQDGRGACWGYGYQGQLGVGARGYTFGPLVVAGGWELASVDAGAHHTCATTTDGAGLCWGYGSEGQIGNGDFPIAQETPAEVAGGLDFSFVSAAGAPYVLGESASGGFSCGITTNGGIFCWGDNLYGQIGDGTSARRRLLPTPIRDP